VKRLVSILLLIVFLFNVGGYYLVYLGLHHRTNLLLTEKIDAQLYNEDETIELKIPVTLPYPIQQNGFERVDGKFEHQGNFYKLIKQKLENDTIYIVCIKDVKAKQLARTFKDYVAKTSDLPANGKGAVNLLGKFLKDFENLDANLFSEGKGWERIVVFGESRFNLSAAYRTLTGPPPKA
jgi:hypothetical protein